ALVRRSCCCLRCSGNPRGHRILRKVQVHVCGFPRPRVCRGRSQGRLLRVLFHWIDNGVQGHLHPGQQQELTHPSSAKPSGKDPPHGSLFETPVISSASKRPRRETTKQRVLPYLCPLRDGATGYIHFQ
ncbi:unnamed protein product, partial [Scytosiphon promiscuus]